MSGEPPLTMTRPNSLKPTQMLALPVIYCPEMVAHTESFSPSAAKPAAVVAAWARTGIPLDIIEPEPLDDDEISLAHDPQYVAGVFAGKRRNGFGDSDAKLAASLRFTNGAMFAAARAALDNGNVAVAPCSGFHHAQFDQAAGFCTFNGLMITALMLKARGHAQRVGILDFDMHFGDGTEALIERFGAAGWIEHVTAGESYHRPGQAREFLHRIPAWIDGMKGCGVLLYQAGADPHVDDPLGGWLTTEQLALRDQLVFKHAARCGVPVAWNLAGGYQRDGDGGIGPVLDIHVNTLKACAETYLNAGNRESPSCETLLGERTLKVEN